MTRNRSRPGSANTTGATNQNSAVQASENQITVTGGNTHFAMVPVWLLGRVKLREVGVYAALHSFTFADNTTCSPTETEIADRLGVSVDTVQRAVLKLVAAGAITVTAERHHDGRRNVYTFTPSPTAQHVRVPRGVLGRVTPAEVGMYAVVRSFNGGSGCHPMVPTIAKLAGLGTTRTRQMLHALADAGVIEIVSRLKADGVNPAPNEYVFLDVPDVAAESLSADPAVGSPQIPREGDRKSRCEPITPNQNSELKLVGWCEPAARDSFEEDLGEVFEEHVAPRNPSESTRDHAEILGGLGSTSDSPRKHLGSSSPTSARNSGWFNQPMADPAEESRVQDLVTLFADGRETLGQNTASPATRENWAASARNMLFGPDSRDYHLAWTLVDKVTRDKYWSGQVRSLYHLATHWDEISAEFSRREVQDFRQDRRVRRRERLDKRVDEADKPGERQSVGSVTFDDLIQQSKELKANTERKYGSGAVSIFDL